MLTALALSLALVTEGALAGSLSADDGGAAMPELVSVSGLYPHLAVTNSSSECGIGVVVPWAGRLWFLTYAPHMPEGSDDKLYWLDRDLTRHTCPESVGGTHAGRMVHRESDQLIIGPHFIDASGRVRTIPLADFPLRITAVMRHLTEPRDKVYLLGMEGELLEVDVWTLAVTPLYDLHGIPVPGTHAKGGCTSQERLVFSNNGDLQWSGGWGSGALIEGDGADWQLVHRAPFTEVTTPDGIVPSGHSEPVWALGWDERSVILRVLENGEWSTLRLPKGSYTHDALHGWYTEWPRIREVTDGKLLAHMHGLFWDFPRSLRASDRAGLRPVSTYLKMPVDYCDWDGRLVMGCNDASLFENPFVSQPSSNLWFGTLEDVAQFGEPSGYGGPWVDDAVSAGEPSDPFLVGGFGRCTLHLASAEPGALFEIEVDRSGRGLWSPIGTISTGARGYAYRVLTGLGLGEWVRLVPRGDYSRVTAYFHLTTPYRAERSPGSRPVPLSFEGLAKVQSDIPWVGGIVRPRGGDLGTLHGLLRRTDTAASTYVEVGASLAVSTPRDSDAAERLEATHGLGDPDFALDAASVVITDGEGRRYRLPRTDPAYDEPFFCGWPRGIREVVTERSLMNIHGTFYELPRPSSGGMERIRPVCTHGKRIVDFCSWRGMLVLAGVRTDAVPDGHVYRGPQGLGLWLGNVDDLWAMGKPRGYGGPWMDSDVAAAQPSDPYLMAGSTARRYVCPTTWLTRSASE